MKTKIITSGDKYIDIDGLASSIAYQKLLKLKNINSHIVFTPALNQSISKTILTWDISFDRKLPQGIESSDLEFILLDISDPLRFDACVIMDQVIEVWDHHFGHDHHWKKLGGNSHIEPIGATSTMIFEEYQKEKLLGKMDKTTANLLYTTIRTHTLNLNAQITTDRDRKAVELLENFIDLPDDWISKYYSEIDQYRVSNPIEAIENDTKYDIIKKETYAIGQAELWDAKPFIFNFKTEIMNSLKRTNSKFTFLTATSISEGKNYLITPNKLLQKMLKKAIGAKFDGDFGQTDKLWLRKEIIRELQKI